MPQKAQHARPYRVVPPFLRQLREEAELTQRALGDLLGKPQSWVHNCETGNRRVDVTEFIEWCRACGAKPTVAVARLAGEDRR
ncbi:MAG: helix-turn-helix transcriptional regulator [Phycisphaeraceae bacterium]|nr:helix-turn-helix domain-containing protein [Phycisphaerales bacterium]QOJ18525.1 MAG: helix-turn-helix transcriptional regulator [Phycisphaeraceae bacterium]